MSTRRASAAHSRQVADTKVEENNIEMKDGSDGSESDNGGEDPGLHKTIEKLSTYLCKVEEDGEELAAGFQRIPNRRVLPDYFEVISEPIAFSTIRMKLLKKQYTSFVEFVRDVAQICHNAQVYNRPSAPIFGAAERLRQIFKQELQKLVTSGQITADDAVLPDLGDIPEAEDSPPPMSDEDEEEEDDDDEEEEEEEEDSDDSRKPGRRRRGRFSSSGRRERVDENEDDAYKRRGRPPSVLTPVEARISSILKGLRKVKDEDGELLIYPFERLPDKSVTPDYYSVITNPIAVDQIKRNAKRKKYHDVDHVMTDIELMFENAKVYNEDDSPLYNAAIELQKQARALAEQEKAKPDDDFRDEDGKLPLGSVDYNGQLWRVGDWVHIRNPNDLAKPIVAQIYRTWQDRAGQRWINACWYYRPEQTVHRFEKHFFEHEVVKTGQYRDHQIEDVLDRCFVMFVTRFPKGRPRGFPPGKEVYVCESRYNEEKCSFAKIKTWASCIPDEVREKDYEMDLFEVPRRMRKVPSPIKHLLREDAKATDELPKPTWGAPNAPPIVGAVHRRPREANESPPPERTPPPPPVATIPQSSVDPSRHHSGPGSSFSVRQGSSVFPVSVPTPASAQYHAAHMTSHFQPVTPVPGGAPMNQTPVPIPMPPAPQGQPGMRPMQYQYQGQHQAPPQHQVQFPPQHQFIQQQGYQQNFSPGYGHSAPPMHQQQHMANSMNPGFGQMGMAPNGRPAMGPGPANQMGHGSMYNPPRPPEVYTLHDNVNEILPTAVRQGFQHDTSGRVLLFTAPPLDRAHKGISSDTAGLGHSAHYLAGRKEWLAEREKKRKERDDKASDDAIKRPALESVEDKAYSQDAESQTAAVMGAWLQSFDKDTERWQNDAGLDGWREPVGGSA